MKTTNYFQYLILQELYNVCSDRINEYFKLASFYKLTMENVVLMKILILSYIWCMMMLLILNVSPELISQGQYGCDHLSRLEMGKDNQLNFHLNDSHHEYSITLIIKSDLVPIILQKPKEDYSGIDLIHLGYISQPINQSDPDALIQKMISELKDQQEVFNTIKMYKKMIFTFYNDDL